jgi:hypothetical protein
MEPEWNNHPEQDDAIMLGLKNNQLPQGKFNMNFGWLKNRFWELKLSISKRICYLSGENIRFKFAYRGRKPIKSILYGNTTVYDDIWISQKSYVDLILSNKID